MSEDGVYKDGDIVWVKLGNNWWPGEVTGPARHPEGLIKHLKRVPYCVVKFFNENTYEYVRNSRQIFPFECTKQDEFIRKGFSLYNSGNSFMEKFPTDVEVAKKLARSKESSLIINDRPDSIVKAILCQPLIRTYDEFYDGPEHREKRRSSDYVTKILNITQTRNNDEICNETPKGETSIMANVPNDKTKNVANAAANNSSNYQCNLCDFTSVRLNVMILHRKMHSNRNSLGSNNSTLSKPTSAKTHIGTITEAAAITTVPNINTDRNPIKQNQIINKNKNISKTKVSTITATAARPSGTPSPLKTNTAIMPLTPKEKNKIIKLQISKEREKNEESAYATILLDFCPNEREASPLPEENQSRRSLRHCKNTNENTSDKVSTLYIDLSEAKTIQKIPKKREYSSMQLQNESSAYVEAAEPDVVCISDKEKETTTATSSRVYSPTCKRDAEDIRRMLLADWSDDDETPPDAIVVEDGHLVENTESNECIFAPVKELHTSAAVVISSTPVVKPSSVSTGRIRNIPKKDRRDVVLQDFNNDLSLIQSDNAIKTVAVDLDSSNSSVVEVIEDKQPAAVITINDDEDQYVSKPQKNQTDLIFSESRDTDSTVGLVHEKSTSAATSTTTLSCFDFQEDEDEQDNNTATIAHFKKKYLSVEKLQDLSSTTTDELKEANVVKTRAEMAEKDKRLEAEIKTLLEQTQHPVADLLNVNSYEENMSVKDLPIKERGKRIFKSRNKTRSEDKTNMEVVSVTSAELSLSLPVETIEEYTSSVNPTTVIEALDDDKDSNEQEHELTTIKRLQMIPDQEKSINKNCLVEISSHENLLSTHAENRTFLGDKQLNLNENKEYENLSGRNKDCLEVCFSDHNTSEEQMKKARTITLDHKNSTENISAEQYENHKNIDVASKQLLSPQEFPENQQQGATENNLQQECLATMNQTQVSIERGTEQEGLVTEGTEEGNKHCTESEPITDVVLNIKVGKKTHTLPVQISEIACNVEKEVNSIHDKEIEKSQDNGSSIKTAIPKSIGEMISSSQSGDKEAESSPPKTYGNEKNTNQQPCSESVFKIRVKSSDQLFGQTFVVASQQELELQPGVDSNIDARLITTTPTDENSSMCASDTGAEFGSPTSMLSEERLPAFRFKTNFTPLQEIEASETELQVQNVAESVQKQNLDVDKSRNIPEVNKHFLTDKPQIHQYVDQKSLQQRRFSMDMSSLETGLKSSKRPRLSVDGTTTNHDNNFEKPKEIVKPLSVPQNKSEAKVRPKNRHMKITPRRNVSDLFKIHSALDTQIRNDVQKSCSFSSSKEPQSTEDVGTIEKENINNDPQSTEDIVGTIEKEKINNDNNIAHNDNNTALNKDIRNANEVLEKRTETKQQVKTNHTSTLDHTEVKEISERKDSVSPSKNQKLNIVSPLETIAEVRSKDDPNSKTVVQSEIQKRPQSPSKLTTTIIEKTTINRENSQQNDLNSSIFDSNTVNIETKITENESISIEPTGKHNVRSLNYIENIEIDSAEISTVTSEKTLSCDNGKTHRDFGFEAPFSPGVPPPTPQEREVVVESENLTQAFNIQEEIQTNIIGETDIAVFPLKGKEKETLNEISDQSLIPQEKEQLIKETSYRSGTLKENELLEEEVGPLLTPLENESITDPNTCPLIHKNEFAKPSECQTIVEIPTPQQPLDMVIEVEKNVDIPCTSKDNDIEGECGNVIQIPCTPQDKDLIIECASSTTQDIIECDHNIPTQVTPEKEIIVESEMAIVADSRTKNILTQENRLFVEKDTTLAREEVVQPKENPPSVNIPQESQPNILQADADKAAEEFLIEFDSIVNHSHAAEEDVPNNTVEGALNTDDLIDNIIEEVHEDQHIKQDATTKNVSPLQYEPVMTYTVVAPKNAWNQIFKESFKRQLPPAKRRQTICFEISDTKEGVMCKKQAFDSILPAHKTIKRTAARKLTLPAIETKLSNSHQPQNILPLNHNHLTLNKKLIPTTKRKLSIEDNITSFVIERPKQPHQLGNATSGPPPLQRIKSLNRPNPTISKTSIDNLPKPPPLQSHDNYNEIFLPESSSPTTGMDISNKAEGGRVIHQQIIGSPAISLSPQNKTTDVKISKNKQIGVDSRGNKYVIIKTPPTDIVVQPTLTPSATVNNFGTTITIQPLARSTTEVKKPTTKNNISSTATTSSSKQPQQIQQISITLPAKSSSPASNSLEISAKNPPRNRRKAAHAKAVSAANSNINSDKHRQTLEALSRRLSVASEAPPLAKLSGTSSTLAQAKISNNSDLTTLFGDNPISNIAQQQLIQLQQQQQQQQQTQTTSTSLTPPIILNKNAHQQSVFQRKTRKLSHQPQQQQHQQHLHNQQQHHQQQQQEIQQQLVTQISSQQQQPQQHNSLQPPPLQIQPPPLQIQPQTVPVPQQILQQSDGIIITTAATEDDNVIDSNTQLIALPTQPYPGYSETFLLCKVKGNTCKPVDNVPLYLNHQLNELVPVPLEAIEGGHKQQEHQIEIKASNVSQQLLSTQNNEPNVSESSLQISNMNCDLVETEISAGIESEQQMHPHGQQHQIMEECVVDESGTSASSNQINEFSGHTELVSNNGILLNIEGQQVLLDATTFAHLLANPDANTQLISDDGTEYVLTHEVLAALQMQQQQQQQQLEQAAGSDIIAVALAGSDLYDNDVLTIDTSQGMQIIDGDGSIVFPAQTGAITQQHLTPPAVVTNAVLDQSPIMSTLEVPSSISTSHKLHGTQLITVPSHHLATSSNAALGVGGAANLEDSLAAIGVTTQSSGIPSSLGLPITVTNPNIASKVTSAGPLNEMLQFVSHRPATAAATAAAVAAAALAGESRIFTD